LNLTNLGLGCLLMESYKKLNKHNFFKVGI